MLLHPVFSVCSIMLSDGVREIPPLLSMTTGCLSLVFSLTIYMKLHLEVILPYALFILIAGALYYFRDGNGPGSQGYGRSRRRLRRDDHDRRSKPEILERKDDDEISQEVNDHSVQEFPSVPDSTRKSRGRQKKKRNSLKFNKSKFKGSMDDSSETSSNSDRSNSDRYPRIETRKEKTKVYKPLLLYTQLNLKMYDMYHEFSFHVLTREQLELYGFPRECSDRPGYIILSPNLVRGSTERRCCRCGGLFFIYPDGTYEANSLCHYHPKKQTPYKRGQPYSGEYPCCNGNYMSEGCVTWQYHVSAESYLHDVEFVRARKKKHLDEFRACTVYAVDCEMLFTTAGMEVAKVGIVGVDGLTVFESFVLPQNKILDYNTLYSGVTEKDLKGISTTLVDVQVFLQRLLNKDSILVGHGLENDLKALRFIHEKVVDTSVVFPYPHSKIYKKSLRALAKEFLNKHIQQSENGHDCIEDARTCMELMLHKVNNDLKNRPPFSQDENRNAILQNIEIKPQPDHPVQHSWKYQPHFNYYTDSFRNSFYSGYLMPKDYYQQKRCIY